MDVTLNRLKYFFYCFVSLNIALVVAFKYNPHKNVGWDWASPKLALVVCVALVVCTLQYIQTKREKKLKKWLQRQEALFDAHPLENWVKIMARSTVQDRVDAIEREGMNAPSVDEVLQVQELEKQKAIHLSQVQPPQPKKVEVVKVQGTKPPSIVGFLQAQKREKPTLTLVHSGPIQTVTNLNFESEKCSPEAVRRAENVRLTNELKERRFDLEEYFIDFQKVTFEDAEARVILAVYIVALSSRLRNLGISLTDDESFTAADTLQMNGDTRELPYLNEDYLDPTYEKE